MQKVINHYPNRLIVIFEKKNEFFDKFSKLLIELGFKKLPPNFPSKNNKATDLTENVDFWENCSELNINIVIIYGKNKIFCIIDGNTDKITFVKKFIEEHF